MLMKCKAAAEALCVSGMVPNDQYCALTANGFNCDDETIKIGPLHTTVTSRTGEPIRSVTAATPLQAVLLCCARLSIACSASVGQMELLSGEEHAEGSLLLVFTYWENDMAHAEKRLLDVPWAQIESAISTA